MNHKTLIEEFLKDPGNLDRPIARALCYWPTYRALLVALALPKNATAKTAVATWINTLLNEPDVCKPAGPTGGINDLVAGAPCWKKILAILLAGAMGNDALQKGLVPLYIRENPTNSDNGGQGNGKADEPNDSAEGPKQGSAYHFYCRFAAAFQAWPAMNALRPPMEVGDVPFRGNSSAENFDISIVDLFYDDVRRTRDAFHTIFGLSAKSIPMTYTKHRREGQTSGVALKYAADVDFTQATFKGETCPYWNELIWMMWEVEDLANLRTQTTCYEKTVQKHVKAWARKEEPGATFQQTEEQWEKLFRQTIHPVLKPLQFTLFVRDDTGDVEDKAQTVKFLTSDGEVWKTLAPLCNALEGDAHWFQPDEPATSLGHFNKVIKELYADGFPKYMFTNIAKSEFSATDADRTFPFIIIPDGEISLLYLLAIANRGKGGIRPIREAANHYTVFSDGVRSEAGDAIWDEYDVSPFGVFPAGAMPPHHRLASLMSVASMAGRGVRLSAYESAIKRIIENFKHWKNESPPVDLKVFLDRLLKDPKFKEQYSHENARVPYEPEIMLRRDDPHCHTLFFLPVGMSDEGIPAAMIAGTLRGVEVSWLPFVSKRLLAYLMPLASIFRPVLDHMVNHVFVEKAKSNAESRASAQRQSELRKRIGEKVETLLDRIDDIALEATRIKSEITPLPMIFFGRSTLPLDKLFEQYSTTEVTDTALTGLEVPNDHIDECVTAKVLENTTQRGRKVGRTYRRLTRSPLNYKCIHGTDDRDGKISLPLNAEVPTAYGLIMAAASVVETPSATEFFIELYNEVKTAEGEQAKQKAATVFQLLKRMLHKIHSSDEKTFSVAELLVAFRLCNSAIAIRYGNAASGIGIFLGDKSIRDNPLLEIFADHHGAKYTFDPFRLGARDAPAPTISGFFNALAEIITDSLVPANGRGAAISSVKLTTTNSGSLEIRLNGDGQLADPRKLKTGGAERKRRGLRSAIAVIEAAVDHPHSFITCSSEIILDGMSEPFVIAHVSERFFQIRLRFKAQPELTRKQ